MAKSNKTTVQGQHTGRPSRPRALEYTVIGAVTFITSEEAFGHGYHDWYTNNPVLIYEEKYGTLSEGANGPDKYVKIDEKFVHLKEYLVKQVLSIEQTQDIYPELFL